MDHDVFMEFEWDGGGLMTLPRLQASLADVRACMKKVCLGPLHITLT